MVHAIVVCRKHMQTSENCMSHTRRAMPKRGWALQKKISRRYAPDLRSPLTNSCWCHSGHQTCAIWQEVNRPSSNNRPLFWIRSVWCCLLLMKQLEATLYKLTVNILFSLITCTTNIHVIVMSTLAILSETAVSLIDSSAICAHHRSIIRLDIHKTVLAAGALPQTPLGELTALPRPPSW